MKFLQLFLSLPEDVLGVNNNGLSAYLTPSNWMQMMNVSKRCKLIKRKTAYYELNLPMSIRYFTEEDFRTTFLQQHIYDPSCQLSLNLAFYPSYLPYQKSGSSFIDIKYRKGSVQHESHFRDRCIVQHWFSVKENKFMFSGPFDLSVVNHIHAINLTRCSIFHLDLTPFQHIKQIILVSNRFIYDVSPLRNVDLLYLEECREVSDVSSLSHVRELTIIECRSILDYTCLTHNQVVSISSMHLYDVRQFANAKKVTLHDCGNVTDITPLKNVPVLDITGCKNIYLYDENHIKNTVKDLTFCICQGAITTPIFNSEAALAEKESSPIMKKQRPRYHYPTTCLCNWD